MASKKKKQKRPTPPPPPVSRKEPRAAAVPAGPSKAQLRARQHKREALRRTLVAVGLAVTAVAAVAAYVVVDRRNDAELREALTSGSCEVDTDADATAAAGQNHVQSPRYAVNPPAGGNHLPSAARAGVYRDGNVPQDGLLVHSLEHGYVIAWYQPALPEEQREQLQQFQAEHEDDVLVVERADMPVPVAATAWGHRLLCQEVEPDTLERFFAEHVGDGPEDVDRG